MRLRILAIIMQCFTVQVQSETNDLCPDIPGSTCTTEPQTPQNTSSPPERLSFTVTPGEIKVNLTEGVAMQCSVPWSSGIRRVTSIKILRQNSTSSRDEDVAAVTSHDAAAAYVDAGNLQAKGGVTANPGAHHSSFGNLQLTWQRAGQVPLGRYECVVAALAPRSRHTTIRQELTLTARDPSISDLIASMRTKDKQQDQLIRQQDQKIHDQQQQIDDHTHESITLHELISKQQQVIDDQAALLSQQQRQAETQTAITTKLRQQFEACMATPNVAFTAVMDLGFNTNHKVILSGRVVVNFDKVVTNVGDGYHVGLFRCSYPGVYVFSVSVLAYDHGYACWQLQLNSQEVATVNAWSGNSATSSSATATLHLKAGDVVRVFNRCYSQLYAADDSRHGNSFTGALVRSDACQL